MQKLSNSETRYYLKTFANILLIGTFERLKNK
jgi:hypothetical protein